MSKGYKLRDDGVIGFKKIMRGKNWIGRVCRHADGSYLGVIGNAMMKAMTETEAFEGIVARHHGFQNASQMRAHGITASRYEHRKNGGNKQPPRPIAIQNNNKFEPVEVITSLPVLKRVNPFDEER